MSVDHYDIVIIGTGAGGGTLAHRLAPSGKRILLIERGGFLPRERENWDEKAVFADARYQADETWYDKDGAPFRPYTHYWVGGNTKVYGAALLRLREHDFREVRHYGGVSPAWPISYAELEPYYMQAERLYSVHGQRGADPCEPPASGEYPHGALDHEPRIGELYRDMHALGYRPFPVALGIRLGERSWPRAPQRLSAFDGYPDLTEAKADAHVVAVDPALAHRNVEILTEAKAERLLTSPTGREVVGVEVVRRGERMVIRGDLFCVACGAINSAALFLRSANDRHPRGLANGSGQVGRNYMTHHNGLFIAVSDEPNDSAFQKTFGMTDFYRRSDDSEFPLGTIQLMGKPDRGTLGFMAREKLPGAPVEDIARRTIDFFLSAEDLPRAENRITLRPDGAICVSYHDTNREAYDRLERKTAQVLDAVDRKRGRRQATYLTLRLGVSGVSHQNGTLRFGTDPKSSVLNTDCRTHELHNCYVVDASFFPSCGAVNPSLTIMANALRVADRILSQLS
jgi:choline dehydrogenase-like flavoprotein